MAATTVEKTISKISKIPSGEDVSTHHQVRLAMAKLKEEDEDHDTCRYLDALTKIFTQESETRANNIDSSSRGEASVASTYKTIDQDGFDTIMTYLHIHRSPVTRGHATLTTSAYLKVSGDQGTAQLTKFFRTRLTRNTSDELILAFSAAAAIFPITPQTCSDLFLMEGFVQSLEPLVSGKRKSKVMEQATLEMLNAACMNAPCREAIRKDCLEWLEEIVANEPVWETDSPEETVVVETGPARESRNLAGVILAKLQAIPQTPAPNAAESDDVSPEERIQPASTSIEELSDMFIKILSVPSPADHQNSIEGLAYASLRSQVKEKLAWSNEFLRALIKTLGKSPAKSPAMYGGLTILVNLTSYQPLMSEEQQRMSQLKAYANARKPEIKPDPLNDDTHVEKRCKAVFEAGVIPMLVTHSQHGSIASLGLVVTIVSSLARTSSIRGMMAQQGGVKLLLHAHSAFPDDHIPARRTASHALARILISTNPTHVFGGSTPLPLTSAIRPLLLLLDDDATTEHRDLLPTFESLLALTNLASTDDDARNPIIRLAWPRIEHLMLENNKLITRAAVELICNLVQSPEGVAKFADGGKQASQHMHVLLALTDAEDLATRKAAGGALAALTEWDRAVRAVLERDGGLRNLLQLCVDVDEDLRHRGVVCVLNVATAPGLAGEQGVQGLRREKGVERLKECLRLSRSQEVLAICVAALKALLAGEEGTKG